MTQHPASTEEQAFERYAADLLRDGTPESEASSLLVEKGLDRDAASTLVAGMSQARSAYLALAKSDIKYGSILLGAGVAVTGITYLLAAPGGPYIAAWGAMLYGWIRIRKGVERKAELLPQARPRSPQPAALLVFVFIVAIIVALALK